MHFPVETRWSERGHAGVPSAGWARLQQLALGTGAAPRADGLDLTVTNPEGQGLVWPVAREIVARAAHARYVPEASGPEQARVAIARTYADRSAAAPVTAEDIVLTASTSESYSLLLHVLCDPGDAVLVPRPSYPLLPDLARLADVRLIPYDLCYAGHFQIDPASLPSPSELLRERVRAVIVVSPNNPTGHFTTKDELALLALLGVPLIVDEVFRPFVHRHHDSFADPLTAPAPLFVLDGLSKRGALPGLKAGWISIAGAPTFRQEARARLEAAADTFLSVSAVAQSALPELLDHDHELRTRVVARVTESLAVLRDATKGTTITLLEPDGGWSAILRLPALRTEERYFEELATLGVWVHPGALYDLPLSPCFVVSLLCPPAQLRAGLARVLGLVSAG